MGREKSRACGGAEGVEGGRPLLRAPRGTYKSARAVREEVWEDGLVLEGQGRCGAGEVMVQGCGVDLVRRAGEVGGARGCGGRGNLTERSLQGCVLAPSLQVCTSVQGGGGGKGQIERRRSEEGETGRTWWEHESASLVPTTFLSPRPTSADPDSRILALRDSACANVSIQAS